MAAGVVSGIDGREPVRFTETTSKEAKWYDEDIGTRLTPEVRAFFRSYCNFEDDDNLQEHLKAIRSRAWLARPYPCIGQWGFLQPKIAALPIFTTILDRVKAGKSILDIGCCFGQDLRWLAAMGAPTHEMYGVDIESIFWNAGFDLYKDRESFAAQFIEADVFDSDSAISRLHGRMDNVYLGSVLHLWDWQAQLQALKTIVRLSKAGTIVAACQIGRTTGREVQTGWKNNMKSRFFLHDPETLHKLWRQVSAETSTQWDVAARSVELTTILPEKRDSAWMDEEARGIIFEAYRRDLSV